MPIEITDALADAGYDRCSTASNHAMDRGTRGIDTTLDALDRVGISHTGMARTPIEIEPNVFEVNGIKVAHMSYTFSYNGLTAANGETWRSALIDSDRIVRDSHRARELGAQVVLVSMHWGNERETAPSSFQQKIADEITKSGEVNLIIGSHAHVLQPIKKVNDTWVIYGLGNFLSISEGLATLCKTSAVGKNLNINTVSAPFTQCGLSPFGFNRRPQWGLSICLSR